MRESILDSIKKLLGIAKEDRTFDVDILIHINSVIMILRQMGVGPAEGFVLDDSSEAWIDYLGEEGMAQFSAAKSYIFLKVRQLFDPATNGAVTESTNNLIKELEYRLYAESEWPTTSRGEPND